MRKLRPVWRQAPSRLLTCLLDPAWFWMMLGTYEDDPIVFDDWQIADLHDYSRVRAREKAPQIGFSWLRACEAVHEALLFEDSTTGFISVDQREATEKVLYARKLYDGLPGMIQRWIPIIREAQEEIAFGSTARPSRVASYPATAGMRGRRMNVILDEADFYKDGGREAYRAGIGRIARGGRLTIGSTCFGQGTMLDRLMQNQNEDGDLDDRVVHSEARYPWTVVENPQVLEGIELARSSLDPNDFAEEYECARGGTGQDPFPPELIRRQTHDYESNCEVDDKGRLLVEIDAPMVGGYDVGQTKNPSILSILAKQPNNVWRQEALLMPMRNGNGLTLPQQHEWLTELMNRVRLLHLVIDGKGIGAHIGEAMLAQFRGRVTIMIPGSKPPGRNPMDKDEMTTELKRMLEAAELELIADREQALQFKKTKRASTGRYEQAGGRKHTHFDRFWATAYAAYGVREMGASGSAYSRRGLTVVGGESRVFA